MQDTETKKYSVRELINNIKNIDHRPTWDEYFMTLAYMSSKRSSCDRQHVGCVIVKNNRVLTTGYNGHVAGAPHISKVVNGHEQMTIHAEQNAIIDAASRGVMINGATAYITHYPCLNCAKMLCASGVTELVYDIEYKMDELCKELYDSAKNKVVVRRFQQ
jgi:dCMP deaminase